MELFNISINTYYLWKKQERPIISLLEKYFEKEDLEEFLKTGQIQKMQRLDSIDYIRDLVNRTDNSINIDRMFMIIDEFNKYKSQNEIHSTTDSIFSDFYDFITHSNLSNYVDYLQLDDSTRFNIENFKLHLLFQVQKLTNIEFYIYCNDVTFNLDEYKELNADVPLSCLGLEDFIEEAMPDNPLV
jgi:hypothetical protein